MFPLQTVLPVLYFAEVACGACGLVQEAALVSPLDPGAGVLLGCCGRLFQWSNSVSLGIVLAGSWCSYQCPSALLWNFHYGASIGRASTLLILVWGTLGAIQMCCAR